MKKLLSILCVAILVFTASSCKKETYVTPNDSQTILTTVKSSAWEVFNTTTNTVDIDVPELTDYKNENYAVLVYIAYGDDAPWEQIPETYEGSAYSFTHNPGHVTLYVQNAGGIGTPTIPDTAYIKIVLVESNPNQ